MASSTRRFKVALSAWSALKAIRYKDRLRVIWVDAICINQTKLEEHEAQLQLMGEIYRKANSVRVWPGSDDDGDHDVISILKTMISTQGVQARLTQEVALGRDVVVQQGSEDLEYKELLAAYHASNAYFGEHLKGYSYG